ncbi:Creatine kinase [Apodemus speciosus]|uniref:Creatine kinase n=1 Tax=Apodemus speciosus TaxID=105296 RepID=A0ABQ0EIZ2_APOSI
MTRVWSSSFTQIRKLFSLLCLRAGGIVINSQDKHWGRWRESFAQTKESKETVDQPHTRFLEHLASLEPFLLRSAKGTQAYQTENGPEENKGSRLEESHSTIWAIYLFWPSLPSASFLSAPTTLLPVNDPYINELLLFRLCHLTEPIVPSSQVTLQATQRVYHDTFYLPSLCPSAGWRETESPDTSASSDS